MTSIKIINQIDITENELKKRNEQVFLHQGDMDGACGVYSLMMALILEGAIKFKDTNLGAQEDKDQREAKQKLFKAFTSADLGLIRNGLYLEAQIQKTLKSTYNKYVKSYYCDGSKDIDVVSFIRKSIDDNHPCIVGIDFRGNSGHFMCAVGYEIGSEEEIVTKIFCLDPGSNKPINTYWNAIIKIDANLNARTYTDYYVNTESQYNQEVRLSEALKIEKKKKEQK